MCPKEKEESPVCPVSAEDRLTPPPPIILGLVNILAQILRTEVDGMDVQP